MVEKEVEIKVAIDEEQAQNLSDNLNQETCKSVEETDTYFDHPERDAIQNNECIRIRWRNGNPVEFTYKPPSDSKMGGEDQFWKEEIDIPIEDEDMADNFSRTLEVLGCEKLVDVVKQREKFELEGRTVVLDRIKDAGCFVEVETITEGSVKDAIKENKDTLDKIGIRDYEVVRQPYRDIVLEEKD